MNALLLASTAVGVVVYCVFVMLGPEPPKVKDKIEPQRTADILPMRRNLQRDRSALRAQRLAELRRMR